MKLNRIAGTIATFGLATCLFASGQTEPYLTVGDKAPSLKSARWLKGSPVIAAGKPYMVEFWATWCGPCKENIPHLTELAHQYKDKLAVIGISVWEAQTPGAADPLKKVTSFVRQQGSKMDYNVAADSRDDSIAKHWMTAAREGGIPCAFVVDANGTIAYIGHPAKVQDVLPKILDHTWDIAAAKQTREAETSGARAISEAMAAKNYPAVLTAVDKAEALKPASHEALMYPRLVALFHTNVPEAIRVCKSVIVESSQAIGAYQMMTSIGAAYDDLKPEAYRFQLIVVDEVLVKQPNGVMFKAIRGEICFHLGEREQAIASVQQAIELAAKEPHITPEFRTMLDKSLVKYRAMKLAN